MDEDEIGLEGELAAGGAVPLEVVLEHLLGEDPLLALERRRDRLRRRVELGVAADDLPTRVEAELAHEEHEPLEHFRRAAAEAGRADVEEAAAAHAVGEAQQQVDGAARRDLAVVVDLDHAGAAGSRPSAAGPASRAASSTSRSRERTRSRLDR